MEKIKKIIILAICILIISTVSVQAGTKAGNKEIGISAALTYFSNHDDSKNYFILGSLGYFITDAFELMVSGIVNWSDNGIESKMYAIHIEPNYHFNTKSMTVPYIGVHAGILYYDWGIDSDTSFSYGAQAGLKAFINENVSLKFEGRYTNYDIGNNGDFDEYQLLVGFQIYW